MNIKSLLKVAAGIIAVGGIITLIIIIYNVRANAKRSSKAAETKSSFSKTHKPSEHVPKAIKPTTHDEVITKSPLPGTSASSHETHEAHSSNPDKPFECPLHDRPSLVGNIRIDRGGVGPHSKDMITGSPLSIPSLLPLHSYSNIPKTRGHCACAFRLYLKKSQIPFPLESPPLLKDKLPRLIEKNVVKYVHDRIIEGKRNKCYIAWRYVLLRYRVDESLRVTVVKHEKRSKLERKGQVEFCIENEEQ